MQVVKFITVVSLSSSLWAGTEKKYTTQEYVDTWKQVAIDQMNQHKIPASITLAQAILESGNGNSDLAQLANNHFGIKCSSWNGDTYYKDDDQKNECFRKYLSASESFVDHSLFLKGKTRYAALFELSLQDYKAWAQGLKDAGYATNPKYPALLIDLIERLNLQKLDEGYNASNVNALILADNRGAKKPNAMVKNSQIRMANTHQAATHINKIKYVVAKKGDTYYRIAKEFNLGMWELYRYNDFDAKKDVLVEGDIIYLEPKKRKSLAKNELKLIKEMTAREISQQEGVKLRRILKMNKISSPDQKLEKGEKIALR